MKRLFLTIIVLLLLFALVWATIEGPNSSTSEFGSNWTNTSNVRLSDDNDASYNATSQDWLITTGYGFTAATGTMDSVIVTVEGSGPSGNPTQRGMDAQLVIGGSGTGDIVNFTLGTNDQIITIVGSTDALFNTGLTVAQFLAAGFGVQIRDDDASANALTIDHIQIRGVYTAAGDGVSGRRRRVIQN